MEQLIFNGPHQPSPCEIELGIEIRGIHLEGLAVGFIVDILVSAAKRGGFACGEEEVEFLWCCRGKIDKSRKRMLLVEVNAYGGDRIYLGFLLP